MSEIKIDFLSHSIGGTYNNNRIAKDKLLIVIIIEKKYPRTTTEINHKITKETTLDNTPSQNNIFNHNTPPNQGFYFLILV